MKRSWLALLLVLSPVPGFSADTQPTLSFTMHVSLRTQTQGSYQQDLSLFPYVPDGTTNDNLVDDFTYTIDVSHNWDTPEPGYSDVKNGDYAYLIDPNGDIRIAAGGLASPPKSSFDTRSAPPLVRTWRKSIITRQIGIIPIPTNIGPMAICGATPSTSTRPAGST